MDDVTTGVPVLNEAGLDNDGRSLQANLSLRARCRPISRTSPLVEAKILEAAIETQIIDTKSGPPHVLRLICFRTLTAMRPVQFKENVAERQRERLSLKAIEAGSVTTVV
jgi:hypothetical protein